MIYHLETGGTEHRFFRQEVDVCSLTGIAFYEERILAGSVGLGLMDRMIIGLPAGFHVGQVKHHELVITDTVLSKPGLGFVTIFLKPGGDKRADPGAG
jgi:hypothetical protein